MYDHAGPIPNQVNIGAGTSLVTSTNLCVYSPVLNAVYCRAFGVTIAVDCSAIAPVFTLHKRITMGSDTGRILLGTLTRPSLSDWVRGKHIYQEISGPNAVVKPGEELLLVLGTGTGTAGFGYGGFYLDPSWGIEGNVQTQKRTFTF